MFKTRKKSVVRNCQLLRSLSIVCLVSLAAVPVGAQDDKTPDYNIGVAAFEAGDRAQALSIWRARADLGDVRAHYSLAVALERDAAPDLKAVEYHYLTAARAGIAAADNNLGVLYNDVASPLYDPDKALLHWQSAAQAGHPVAQYNYGLSLLRRTVPAVSGAPTPQSATPNSPIPESTTAARIWLDKAAQGGINDARYTLARVYGDLPARRALMTAAAEGHALSRALLRDRPELKIEPVAEPPAPPPFDGPVFPHRRP